MAAPMARPKRRKQRTGAPRASGPRRTKGAGRCRAAQAGFHGKKFGDKKFGGKKKFGKPGGGYKGKNPRSPKPQG